MPSGLLASAMRVVSIPAGQAGPRGLLRDSRRPDAASLGRVAERRPPASRDRVANIRRPPRAPPASIEAGHRLAPARSMPAAPDRSVIVDTVALGGSGELGELDELRESLARNVHRALCTLAAAAYNPAIKRPGMLSSGRSARLLRKLKKKEKQEKGNGRAAGRK